MTVPSSRAKWILSCMGTLIMWRCFYPVQFAWKVSFSSTILQVIGIVILGSLILFLLNEFPFVENKAQEIEHENQDSGIPASTKRFQFSAMIQSPWFPLVAVLVIMLTVSSVKLIDMSKKQRLFLNTGNGTYYWFGCKRYVKPSRMYDRKKFIRVETTRFEVEADGFQPWYGCPR